MGTETARCLPFVPKSSSHRRGHSGARRSQPEVLALIDRWERGEYTPKSKRERQWLRARARQFKKAAVP